MSESSRSDLPSETMRGGSGSLPRKRSSQLRLDGCAHALVTAAQDGDAASAGLQSAREFLHDRCLAGAADGQVADADDETAQRAFAQDAFAIERRAAAARAARRRTKEIKQRTRARRESHGDARG